MNLPAFLIPIIVGLLTQAIKPLLNKHWYAQLEEGGKKIPRYGGMPSAHTAFAASLVTLMYLTEGPYSLMFAVAVTLLIYVLDDALRMRMFLSRHGQALRMLVENLLPQDQKKFPYLESRLGHKVAEVIVGGIIGVVLTCLIVSFAL